MLETTDSSPALSQDTTPEQQEPVESGKRTRQWAAWTHEEEEKFFSALRQVGKDFEKITSQVVSKNKDQVRHYYYRLIKRMNKFLRSDLLIDARNSKDVDSAMLCWWSLLEKFKCSSSKLHLKPRRLKAIATALEQHRLKDRKKAKKKVKAPSTSTDKPASVVAGEVRKRSFTRAPVRPQVKAASDSVLEPPESELNSKIIEGGKPEENNMEKQNSVSTPTPSEPNLKSSTSVPQMETAVLKIKLQLFPIDDKTKTALEQEGHNPHLELTLKASKSISSVLQHLSQKWGRCSVATGDIRLYPFIRQPSSTSWNSKDVVCAADVYDAVGRPSVFRLRYGWCQNVCEKSSKSGAEPVTVIERHEDHSQLDSQVPGCSWLYDRSTDGFGQRLWRDEELLGASSVDRFIVLNDASKQDADRYSLTPSVWGGEETCDAFSFKTKEHIRVVPPARESAACSLLGTSQGTSSFDLFRSSSNADVLRSSALDLYWADSLGAVDGTFAHGQSLLLNGNSSLGGGISTSLFPDSPDAFAQQTPGVLLSPNDIHMVEVDRQ
ncbi:hypothetical protein SELMODRAFT_410828 [Selaginella moellendorffii]|uniref:Uncharacterized protein n=1 Tax=Selaginella moellendorffii TaxID=88036 RepID=D8RG00_SELML|nr:TSL-kinase interacting protein 1 [Selaginella moellendorffii]XP_024530761.1 TSL-kinase interacting protein 1 [Selaginella moellendorffii]XP_024530762.1 TSL-kinase interacting protein 1 [Selaginella moellendorffii]EFJ29211.1 hypothetical protein SELMODRAFT_410828 [Selaginella moellendorffii]|eukprot:XP_002970087.1 TSL-kinase interacting protein 1 [Selaginella moellendorffii]